MCLVTKQVRPKTAKEPITCYKVIRKDMSALHHRKFKWEFGKLFEQEMRSRKSETFKGKREVLKGFFSFVATKVLQEEYRLSCYPCMIVECTIPEGAKYYRGDCGGVSSYVSNQLIINKIIDVKEVITDFDWDNCPYKEGQTIKVIYMDGSESIHKIANIQPDTICHDICFVTEDGLNFRTDRTGKPYFYNWQQYQIEIVEPTK